MRKDAKTRTVNQPLYAIADYHDDYDSRQDTYESYAYAGFAGGNKVFTSDRWARTYEEDGVLKREDGKSIECVGLEIETECEGIRNSAVLATILCGHVLDVMPRGLFKLQYDGSLSGDTVAEIITQPMTPAFVRNHYPEFRHIFNVSFRRFHISAASVRCGMHVNLSFGLFGRTYEKQEENMRKFSYIVNKHWGLCKMLFNRMSDDAFYFRANPDMQDMEYAKTCDMEHIGGHHNCVNTEHYDAERIELRLVGGCGNYGAFRNTMECVFFLIKRVKKLAWKDCDDIVKIFDGCNQYVYDRLSTLVYQSGLITADELSEILQKAVREDLI